MNVAGPSGHPSHGYEPLRGGREITAIKRVLHHLTLVEIGQASDHIQSNVLAPAIPLQAPTLVVRHSSAQISTLQLRLHFLDTEPSEKVFLVTLEGITETKDGAGLAATDVILLVMVRWCSAKREAALKAYNEMRKQ